MVELRQFVTALKDERDHLFDAYISQYREPLLAAFWLKPI